MKKMIPDDSGGDRIGQAPRGSCLAISAHLSDRGRGPHHHVEAARRWCSIICLDLSAGPDPLWQTEGQRSSSVVLEAARFKSDSESLRAPFLA